MKASVIIPYKNRLNTIIPVLEAIFNQNISKSEYEVILGSLDSYDKTITLKEKYPFLKIITHLSEEWNPSLARNIGIKAAKGKRIILIDADILVKKDFISSHLILGKFYDIIVGSVANYNENKNMKKDNFITKNDDIRWSINPNDAPLKWALCWTGNISINRRFFDENIYFDESFTGWGGEDLEFMYKLKEKNATILFCKEISTKHLSHIRNVKINREQEKINFIKFLYKHQDPEVEFVVHFGDLIANKIFKEYYCPNLLEYCIIIKNNMQKIIIGVKTNKSQYYKPYDEILNLSGISLPFMDHTFKECILLKTKLNTKITKIIKNEIKRLKK